MKIAHCGLLILLAAPFGVASARPSASAQNNQSQTDSLAAAARRAREQQKERPKAGKVWDNDNIPTAGGVDVVGQPPAPTAPTAAKPEEPATKESAEAAKKKKEKEKADLEAQLKAAQSALKDLQTDLDILQRKYALDQQSFYQNPNYSSDASGAAALKDEENQIQAKKEAVDAAQEKVDDLDAKVKTAESSSGKSESK